MYLGLFEFVGNVTERKVSSDYHSLRPKMKEFSDSPVIAGNPVLRPRRLPLLIQGAERHVKVLRQHRICGKISD